MEKSVENLNKIDNFSGITSQIEYTRHRLHGFTLNLLGDLNAYCLKKDKLSMHNSHSEMAILVMT